MVFPHQYQLNPILSTTIFILIRKEKSNDPTYTISPFCGGAVICHNNKIVIPLQLKEPM
jgi:hypothetical protein